MHSLIFGLLIKVGRFCMLIKVGIFRMPIKAGIFGMLIKVGIICRIEKEVVRARFNFSSLVSGEQNEKRDMAMLHFFACAQVWGGRHSPYECCFSSCEMSQNGGHSDHGKPSQIPLRLWTMRSGHLFISIHLMMQPSGKSLWGQYLCQPLKT